MTNKEKDIKSVQDAVSKNIPRLTIAALSAALGSTVVLKMTTSDTGRVKYVPCDSTEEIIQALDWISEYGNQNTIPSNTDNKITAGFFIVQQKQPDPKFWDALVNRHIGKIPDEAKLEVSHKIDFAAIGRKAAQYTVNNSITNTEPVPISWSEPVPKTKTPEKEIPQNADITKETSW